MTAPLGLDIRPSKLLLGALEFAARKHSGQKRKDSAGTPYINHPVAVAALLADVGQVDDLPTLVAALLHDTLEDTNTTADELARNFGEEVLRLVQEVTDDKSLPKQVRKDLQVLYAPNLSHRAKQIKIADKICNLNDLTISEPHTWNTRRKVEYVEWSVRVVAGCRNCNPGLEREFDNVVHAKRVLLNAALQQDANR
jgi:guanosine-3',5'-bis(diphosphate) 3'-pyrophosphohydrolase